MSENYFYSSLSGQEIEARLVGAVVCNYEQALTTTQKAQARANIGAGEASTSFKIMGYFATLDDLKNYLTSLPSAGDAYGISVTPDPEQELFSPDGTQTDFTITGNPYYVKVTESGTVLTPGTDYFYANSVVMFVTAPPAGTDTVLVEWSDQTEPYDIWVFDAIANDWVNNGQLISADIIDDTETSATMTWSSQKINSELSGKQDTLGNGDISTFMLASKAVTRAKLADDVISPIIAGKSANYSIAAGDYGSILRIGNANNTTTITMPQAVATGMPMGAEIGFINCTLNPSTTIVIVDMSATGGCFGCIDGDATSFSKFKIVNGYEMVTITKIFGAANQWLVSGNVEVVT